tara:strand:- start:3856 stop:4134 length:279 start_codon:yes stop_codon:yes gene_type:complete
MKYFVTFQQFNPGNGRPIDHPSASDFETDDKGFGMVPHVGDFVQIEPLGNEGAPRFSGKVKHRLFRYLADNCHVNIVVEDYDGPEWAETIKE